MKNILVTGANGFLGKAVMKSLHDKGHRPVGLRGRADWDLTRQKHVDYLLQNYEPDIIVHLAAACGGIGINREQPGRFMYDNLAMGMNLIESCRKYGKLDKFVMVGTVCSYPKYSPIPFKETDIWNGYPEETNAPYGIAKKTLTEMLIAYAKQYEMRSANLIPVNMYGPHDHFDPVMSHVIPAIILKIDRAITVGHGVIELWGTGDASREFLYVDDCAEFITLACTKDTNPLPINIGTGIEIKIKDLVAMIAKIMGYKGEIVYNSDYPDGQPRRCLDTSLSKSVFGIEAPTGLYEGLQKTISWYYANKDKENFSGYFDHIQ